jgi:hypothetical protein
MYAPKSRVRYVPSVGPVRPATVLAVIDCGSACGGGEAYQIRLMDGRKLTVSASQIQPKVKGQSA